jgi:hypothetical protein
VYVNLILYGGCIGFYYAPYVCSGKPSDPENYNLVKKTGSMSIFTGMQYLIMMALKYMSPQAGAWECR